MNTFTLIATDDLGIPGQAVAKVLLDTIPPVIAITAPAPGATFTISRVNVSGTVSDANVITSVKVNGVPAYVGAGQFTAYNVPLAPGANTFVAVATDVAGNVGTANRAVKADASANGGLLLDPVSLAAAPVSGFAPLTVTFTPQSQIPGTLQTVTCDFDGDMVPDLNASTLAPVTHTYAAAGEFFPTVTVATSTASASSPGGIFADPATRLTLRVENPPLVQATFNMPTPIDLHAAPDGTLYVLSQSTATVTQYNAAGGILRTATGLGTSPGGLTVDAFGNVFVAETGNHQVVMLAPNGNTFDVVMTLGKTDATAGTGDGEFDSPYDVAVSPAGEIYVTDTGNQRILKFGADGTFAGAIGGEGITGGWTGPKGIVYGGYGNLWVIDSTANHLVNVADGLISEVAGIAGNASGEFQAPRNVASRDEDVYVADTGNNRIQKFYDGSSGGHGERVPTKPIWQIGSGLGLSGPSSVAVRQAGASTLLHLADTGNNRVLIVQIPHGNSPILVWNAFATFMRSSELELALSCMTTDSAEQYREAFQLLGSAKRMAIVDEVGVLTPEYVGANLAKFTFTRNLSGRLVKFSVSFAKENGRWKIIEF